MMTYTLELEESINLVSFKLETIKRTISEILTKWKFNTIEQFLEDTKNGKFDEGVMDAISMKQLVHDSEKYELLLSKLKEE
ncbi:MAG: hypothetical protein GPJ54_18030 [Candidatus Heimdallarchaeota archaeon]|nr:hypothetical protein [Candidatus Heimdallarchaeota archaeon]